MPHSRGPWRVVINDAETVEDTHVLVVSEDSAIAEVFILQDGEDAEDRTSQNAFLIAAAPHLLAACEGLLAAMDLLCAKNDHLVIGEVGLAEVAIKLARGGQS